MKENQYKDIGTLREAFMNAIKEYKEHPTPEGYQKLMFLSLIVKYIKQDMEKDSK
jgi:hypothetical protein